MKIKFMTSAAEVEQFIVSERPEVALAGRSNSGKSSFLNALAGKPVAKVSQTPGKTRLINFFEAGEHYILVDMPGYGYASRSGDEVRSWQDLIEGYIQGRDHLVGLVLIMDIRRHWSDDEQMMLDYMNHIGRPLALVLNKADKLNAKELRDQVAQIKRDSNCSNVFVVSAEKRTGIAEVEEFIYRQWVKK